MAETNETAPGYSRRNEILIDCLYAVAIGVNALIILDQATDGAVSKELARRMFLAKNQFLAWHERSKEHRRDRWEMWQQVRETVSEAAGEKEGE